MYIALTADQSRRLDSYMISEKNIPGVLLMENAAAAVADRICELGCSSICIVSGTGNNGGDGFALARILVSRGLHPEVAVVGDIARISGDARINFDYMESSLGYTSVTGEDDLDALYELLEGAELTVDALFGTGLDRGITGLYATVIEYINDAECDVISIDIPSGINADTGQIMGCAVRADYTVACQTAKIGHFVYPGAFYSGDLFVAYIGDDEDCPVYGENPVIAYELFDEDLSVSKRMVNANKGDFGKLLVVAGSKGMAGAAHMCALAAARSGAGLTTVASVPYVCDRLQTNLPEVMTKELPEEDGMISSDAIEWMDSLAADKTCIAVGPGLGIGEGTSDFVRSLVENYNVCKIFDADALNIIANDVDMLHSAVGETVLTPHPKEFSRLTGLSVDEILSDPVSCAKRFAGFYGVTVLLKGACTVVASPDGDVSLIRADVPAMAKGGCGDILTGIVSALTAQNGDVYMSCVVAANINVCAGFYAQSYYGEYSVLARDIADNIGKAFISFTDEDSAGCDIACHGEGGVYAIDGDDESERQPQNKVLQYREMQPVRKPLR